MTDNNKHQNKTEALNEEAKGKELSMEELEQVTGGLKESGPGLVKPSTTF